MALSKAVLSNPSSSISSSSSTKRSTRACAYPKSSCRARLARRSSLKLTQRGARRTRVPLTSSRRPRELQERARRNRRAFVAFSRRVSSESAVAACRLPPLPRRAPPLASAGCSRARPRPIRSRPVPAWGHVAFHARGLAAKVCSPNLAAAVREYFMFLVLESTPIGDLLWLAADVAEERPTRGHWKALLGCAATCTLRGLLYFLISWSLICSGGASASAAATTQQAQAVSSAVNAFVFSDTGSFIVDCAAGFLGMALFGVARRLCSGLLAFPNKTRDDSTDCYRGDDFLVRVKHGLDVAAIFAGGCLLLLLVFWRASCRSSGGSGA